MNDTRLQPGKWWIVGGLLLLVAVGGGVQWWREAQKPAPVPKLHDRYAVGQRWHVAARPHEKDCIISIVKLERLERHGRVDVIVHARIAGVRMRTPSGVIEEITILPFTPEAIDASVLGLVGLDGGSWYDADAMKRWRVAFEGGRAGIIRANVRVGIDMTEASMNR